ncbi:MAG TPA: ElyC/SanA/YdcF family protein [Blastocatellia bacterium]
MLDQWRKIRWKAAWIGLLLILMALAINGWIVRSGAARTFTDPASLPANDVGLVLGTSARTFGGYANPHFQARIAAAARLYQAGKLRHLLLSGDNHVQGYDEPSDMKEALARLGVPEAAMTLDYAGFRTLDSVARAKAVFGQTRLTVITDDFHVHRALFLCRAYGIDAVAFCSDNVPLEYSGKTRMREWLARVKAWLDVYILRTAPKFYGPPVEIKILLPGPEK